MSNTDLHLFSFKDIARQIANRPILTIAVFYCVGIVLARLWYIQNISQLTVVIVLTLLSLLFFVRVNDYCYVVLLAVTILAGIMSYNFATLSIARDFSGLYNKHVGITGPIIEEPVIYGDYTAYRLKAEIIESDDIVLSANGTVLLHLYGSDNFKYNYGEKLQLSGVIVEPRGKRNPGGFDYRFHLQGQGIGAIIYADTSAVNYSGNTDGFALTTVAIELRSRMENYITEQLPSPSAELLIAVLFGKRDQLPEDVSQSFQRAGVGHLMAVSGLHVGLVAAMLLGLWKILGLRGKLPVALAIILIFVYAWLTGMRPSTLRAALMVSAALIAVLLDRERDIPISIAFAALFTLFINPLLLFNIGFQLSYTATLALVYLYKPIELLLTNLRVPKILKPLLCVTITAQTGVLPLCLYYFQHIPTGAIIFNLFLLPLIPIVVGLGLAGAVTSLLSSFFGSLFLWASRPVLELMIMVTSLSNNSFFYIPVKPPGVAIMTSYYLLLTIIALTYYSWQRDEAENDGITFITYLRKRYLQFFNRRKDLLKTATILLLLVALFTVWLGIIIPGEQILTVTFIDVGQGASALIETHCGLIILVDAGGSPAFKGDVGAVGEKVIMPLLRHKGISSIDLAIITHPHEDHYGGFLPIVDNLAIDLMLISPVQGGAELYDELLVRAAGRGTVIQDTWAGQFWHCGEGIMLEIIGPPEELYRGTSSDLNNNSVVFLLHYGEISMLLTGDIEDTAVERLIGSGSNLQASVFQVPHHGGYLGAIEQLLEAVMPEIAVIQVGPNSFGHPHPHVIEALDIYGVVTYRNDYHGAVVIETDGRSLWVETMSQGVVRQAEVSLCD